MAKKAKDGEGEQPKRGKGRLLLMVGLCLAMVGGGYVLGGRGKGAEAEGAATATTVPGAHDGHESTSEGEALTGDASCTPTTEPHELGTVIDIPAMNVNLADGHYLRAAVSLELSPEAEVEKPEEFPTAPARDEIVTTLSGRTVLELSSPTGRDEVKTELTDAIVELYHGEVHAVYLTEFVMQ